MKKHFYILALILLLVILIFILLWFRKEQVNNDLVSLPLDTTNNEVIVPVFMTDDEKSNFGLPLNSQVQVLRRAESGEIMSYKIIKSDDEVITNRKQLQVR